MLLCLLKECGKFCQSQNGSDMSFDKDFRPTVPTHRYHWKTGKIILKVQNMTRNSVQSALQCGKLPLLKVSDNSGTGKFKISR